MEPQQYDKEDKGYMSVEESPEASEELQKQTSLDNSMTQARRNNKGRPKMHKEPPEIIYANRKETLEVYNKHSIHKRTLVLLELIFCYERMVGIEEEKTKKASKGENKRYQRGFLQFQNDHQREFNNGPEFKEMIKNYEILSHLFQRVDRTARSKAPDERDLADMVEMALAIKNDKIKEEWCLIYDFICERVLKEKGQGSNFVKTKDRNEWMNNIAKALMELIQKQAHRLPFITKLRLENSIDLLQLLKREAYCFVADFFNFNNNEYFNKANICNSQLPSKKAKMDVEKTQ